MQLVYFDLIGMELLRFLGVFLLFVFELDCVRKVYIVKERKVFIR